MKNLFILFLLFSSFSSAQKNYYVANAGDDNNAGTIDHPFKTLSKASIIGSPGDWVLFNRGDSFYGTLSARSGINYGSYGNGVKAVLTGFQNVSGWIQSGTNLWQAPLSSSPNLVLVNGSFAAIGKWPNGNKVYNTINSFTGGTSLTSSSITTTWTGGTVIIRKNHWILDKSPITSQSGSKINFTNPTSYNCQTGWGFFIQNIQAACDQQNEWWYSNGQLGIYSSSQPVNIKAASIGTLVDIGSATNVTFHEIEFQGSNTSTVNISTGNNVLFEFCDFNYAGINGFTAASSAHDITLKNCTSNYTNNDFIQAGGSSYWSISNCQLSNTGTIAGMGSSGDGNYIGIYNIGIGSVVQECTFTNCGYIGIDFRGSNTQILNNTVNGFCQVKDDGAGIYTFSTSANGNYGWRTVSGNTVLNGGGASAGTNTVNSDAFGIYLDNNSSEVLVTGNYIHDCGSSGLFLHGTHNVTITKNIVYNTVTTGGYGQFLVTTDASFTDMRNVTVTNNQFVSKTSSQVAGYFSAGKSDYNQWGRFDSNYYSGNKFYVGGNTTLAGWQSTCGGEVKSTSGNPQTTPPDPTVTYYSQQQSQAFTRNNCASGSTGSQVIYAVPANQYSSTISQADADAKATADINSNGQAYANANGTCVLDPTTYYNVVQSKSFTRNDCGSGYTGADVIYTVPANKYSSTVSQTDADAKATADVNSNGQAYANANGTCVMNPTTYYNLVQSKSFTRNDCGSGYTGADVMYTVPADKYSSTVSQADADAKATADVNSNGQAYANANGTCVLDPTTYYNVVQSKSFTRNDCGSGYTGADVVYTVPANKYSSTVSQADADAKAIADINSNGQDYANANGSCEVLLATYYNLVQSKSFTRNDCGSGYTGSDVIYTVPADKYSSTVSQGDADAKATADINSNGQDYANANGNCAIDPTNYYNVVQSKSFTRNDCGSGSTGSQVIYTVPANQYSSTISQADADAKATADVNSNGQVYANANGSCVSDPTTYYNIVQSKSFTRNDCGSGYTGADVIYTVPANKYSSALSQTDADAKATADINSNGQAYANANGACVIDPTTYYNVVQSKSFTRNNCGSGYTGSDVVYTVPADKYSSTISQADADTKATADINSNGQAYANANGTCVIIPTTYYNVVQSKSFTRNNCGSGSTGSNVIYTVPANQYSSTISQADADAKATTDINSNGQTYANANGVCTNIYYNVVQSKSFTRNNCGSGYTGSNVVYTVPAAKYSSTVSQADADAKATADINSNGQTYANTNGACTKIYYNIVQSKSFTRNNCVSGYTGSSVAYTVPAAKYSSTISQSDADAKATADINSNGQTYANANGVCTKIYYNVVQSKSFTRNNCVSGYAGSSVVYTVPASKYSSTVSQSDADAKATADINANGQTYANTNGACTKIYYNVVQSKSFTRNNCGSGYAGSSVVYTVPASKYSSTVSQSDADSKATADINANGQAYANANGLCVRTYYNVAKSKTFTRNNCSSGYAGSSVVYTVPANKYSSTVSQSDADAKATADINANGQTYANANGVCSKIYYNVAKSKTFSRNNCGTGYAGSSVVYTVPAAKYSSTISQSDADAKATTDINTNGQAYANANGVCVRTYYNVAKSKTFIRNNCSFGYTGSSVVYTVPAAKYSSTVSQTDADAKATADINANGQAYANANGTCTRR